MEENLIKSPLTVKVLWRDSMKYGAILGLFTVACLALNQFIMPSPDGSASSALIITILGYLLWAVRTGGCIFLMVTFAKKLVAEYENATRSHTFRLNMFTSLFSSLITSAFTLLLLKIQGNEQIMEAMQGIIDTSEDLDIAMQVAKIMTSPAVIFFSTFSGCFLLGLLIALLISRSIPKRVKNPFER